MRIRQPYCNVYCNVYRTDPNYVLPAVTAVSWNILSDVQSCCKTSDIVSLYSSTVFFDRKLPTTTPLAISALNQSGLEDIFQLLLWMAVQGMGLAHLPLS